MVDDLIASVLYLKVKMNNFFPLIYLPTMKQIPQNKIITLLNLLLLILTLCTFVLEDGNMLLIAIVCNWEK